MQMYACCTCHRVIVLPTSSPPSLRDGEADAVAAADRHYRIWRDADQVTGRSEQRPAEFAVVIAAVWIELAIEYVGA